MQVCVERERETVSVYGKGSVWVCVERTCVYVWWGLGRNKPGEEMRPGEITLGSKCYVKK